MLAKIATVLTSTLGPVLLGIMAVMLAITVLLGVVTAILTDNEGLVTVFDKTSQIITKVKDFFKGKEPASAVIRDKYNSAKALENEYNIPWPVIYVVGEKFPDLTHKQIVDELVINGFFDNPDAALIEMKLAPIEIFHLMNDLVEEKVDMPMLVDPTSGMMYPLPPDVGIVTELALVVRTNADCTTYTHKGTDIAAPEGTEIYAALGGRVVTNIKSTSGGFMVAISNDDGFKILYMHMVKKSPLPVGTEVAQGDVIGHVGSTGRSTGNHLHFEIWKDNQVRPATDFMTFDRISPGVGTPLDWSQGRCSRK
ncbi:Murein DD-endopeptidase MepM [compost metagenome]